MYKILKKEELNSQVTLMEVQAPLIAKKCLAGQFIILRVNELGERIPLTVADYNRETGTVTIIFQKIGKTTSQLGMLNQGDCILDFVGPLGIATHVDGAKKIAVIGGGVGCAIAYPQAKAFHDAGADVTLIAGFRSKDIVILENEMRDASSSFHIVTDDGTYGDKGLVTNKLEELILAGEKFDEVIAIGPLVMMKFVCLLTKKYEIPTMVSMNPVMIDGTGMCGCCRLTVGGKVKFACVDGPDFDGHLVNFDEAIQRSSMYKNEERQAMDRLNHSCNLLKGAK